MYRSVTQYLVVVLFLLVNPPKGFCQSDVLSIPVTLQVVDVPLNELLNTISQESGVFFSYNSAIIPEGQLFTYRVNQLTLRTILTQILVGTGLEYKVVEDQIIINKIRADQVDVPSTITIFGTLTDVITGEPVEGANVFIANTLKGDGTNDKGYFEIEGLAPGTYDLIFSHIGYVSFSQTLAIDDITDLSLKIEMDPRITQLPEVRIRALPEKEWQKHYETFEKEFLGRSANASRCYILNKEVLDFQYDPVLDLFVATAYDAIQIENLALGYKIDYILDEFQKVGDKTRILGKPRFFELSTEKLKEKKRWKRNREKSYLGSLTHFLKSLCNNRLKREGFVVNKVYELPIGAQVPYYEVNTAKIIQPVPDNEYEKLLHFEDYLQIIYTGEAEQLAYVEENRIGAKGNGDNPYLINPQFISAFGSGQVSYMDLNIASVRVDKRGFIYDPLAITTYGYWSWERIAEILPIEYIP